MSSSSAVRKPNASASDLLSWSENLPPPAASFSAIKASDLLSWSENLPPPSASFSAVKASDSASRSHQPSDGTSKAVYGDQITEEEADSFNRSATFRKPCSGYMLEETTGNKIFKSESANSGTSEFHTGKRTTVRIVEPSAGISKVLYGDQITEEEAESFNRSATFRKPCSGLKETTGNKIFEAESANRGTSEFHTCKRTSVPIVQPSDGISKALYGGQITEAEAESFNRSATFRKPCSEYKFKETTANRIFGAESPNSRTSEFHTGKNTSVCIGQQATKGMSQISFSSEEKVSPKKPASFPEIPKQHELSGTVENESNLKTKKPFSNDKCKELSGNTIFGPPSELPHRTIEIKAANKQLDEPAPPPPQSVQTSIRVSSPAGGKSNIMFQESKMDARKKTIHNHKLREMSGSDIFADGKAELRGGVRK